MIEYNVRKNVPVRIPTSARDWELYTSKAGVGEAARGMTAALKRSIRHAKRALKRGPYTTERVVKALSEAFKAELDKAMGKYGDFGAWDTEPRYNGKNAMIRAISLFLYGDSDRLRWDGVDTWSF